MVSVKNFYDTLISCGINLFTGVPDSLLKNFCAYVTDHSDSRHNIIAANEGNAIGIAAGHYLATGNVPLVYMQNSGIGNAVNPLLSLADEKVYSIPVLLVIGWRGEPGVHDEPQHVKQGGVTLPLLEAMDIPYIILPEDENEALTAARNIVERCKTGMKPHAIIIRKGIFGNYSLKNKVVNNHSVSREDALRIVVANMKHNDVVVSTTGKLSRELYELRESMRQGHEHDFLTVGSMGHSSSIALGIALEKPDRRVWCLDGDGAFIMHMGALTGIGALKPQNLVHVVFNNGAHESVGGQPTQGFNIDMPQIARRCGYSHVFSAYGSSDDITTTLAKVENLEGPVFIELKVGINSRENLGRPTSTPIENKNVFMTYLR